MKRLNVLAISIGLSFAVNSVMADDLRLDNLFDSYSSGSSGSLDTRGGTVYTGGEFTARFNQPNIRVISFNPPSASVTCGGVDLYGGSFGFMSSDQVVQVGRAVAQGAAVYFFQMAMDSICPSCSKTISSIQSAVQQMNNFAKDACGKTNQFLKDIENSEDEKQKADDATHLGATIDSSLAGHIDGVTDYFFGEADDASESHLTSNAQASAVADAINTLGSIDLGDFTYFDFGGDNAKEKLTNLIMTLGGTTTSSYNSATKSAEINPVSPGINLVEYLTSTDTLEKAYERLLCADNYIECTSIDASERTYTHSVYTQISERVTDIYSKYKNPDLGSINTSDIKFQQLIGMNIETMVHAANESKIADELMQKSLAVEATKNYIDKFKVALGATFVELKAAKPDGQTVSLHETFKESLDNIVSLLSEAKEILKVRDEGTDKAIKTALSFELLKVSKRREL